ncbi:hypothetical protein L1987_40019 [Smallanthus sonchifolius]|uniref:Uncharacterized protein n=1 Tax=Smallanthus sonchifolius TaxID=185202 RepID=A0ACB9GT38_9ASTR|nr:hypothetical protein L1987_40019 [Smallanthus sonchifolius]
MISNLAVSYAQSCNNYTFSSNAIYATCVSLPVLNSHLHWTYHSNGTVDVAFRHTGSTTSQWVACGLNVRGLGMIGAQAIVAVANSSGETHGVLNAISWGVLMPMGAMAARYLKVFNVANSAWFYIHAATQTSAYIVGVAGWATGLKLGSDSTGIKYNTHRNIGIILFAFGTLQVFALLLRPKPDNKYRFYWNIYHRGLGYSVIVLSIINVYKGLDIFDPEKKWKNAYTGIIISLGVITVFSEALTWIIVLKRKKEDKVTNGCCGANGYGQSA